MTAKRTRLRTTSSSADQQPSVSHCEHVDVCHSLTYRQLTELKKKPCHECSFAGKNRWLCLTDSCKLIFCGSSGNDHSDAHSAACTDHNLMLNLSNWRVWCHSCEGEVYPDRNIPSWSVGEQLLGQDGIAKLKAAELAGPLAKIVQAEKLQAVVSPQVHQSSITSPVAGRAYNDRGETHQTQCHEVEDEMDERSPRGLTGLQNLGNTCYANAALQALSNCVQLREYFNEQLSNPKSVTGSEPSVSKAFNMLLKTIWSPSRPGYTSPRMILSCVRTVYPQFRGWAQQDSQEFIRCFLDLLHRELRHPVYDWEQRDRPSVDDAPQRRHSVSSSDSDRSSVGSDNFETADSGWSSDGDGKTVIRPRKRVRTNSPSVSESQSDRRPKSPSSSSSTASLTKVRHAPSKVPKQRPPDRYRSLITDVFDGRIQSTVHCLTCRHVSDTTETFQDLSLPIPSKEQIDHLIATHAQHDSAYGSTDSLASHNGSMNQQGWIPWLMYGWMGSLWNYMAGPTVTLRDCLNAFFSPDDLRGDDMYSCEKCAKLRNGVKICRIVNLPEVLCIHLKRFRHDAAYSSKVNTTVTFPLDDLDMSPFVHQQCSDQIRRYELVAFITHYGGGADSGHYIAYCRNELNGHWYEFDDTMVSRVEVAEVLTKEAYVLFYQKKSDSMNKVRDHVRSLLESGNKQRSKAVSRFHISREWLHRYSTFAEPGPITNFDFLCPHGLISPRRAKDLSSYYAEVPSAAWDYLHQEFGGGPVCSTLQYCVTCQNEFLRLQTKRNAELAAYKQLEKMAHSRSTRWHHPPNLIIRSWFARWERFVLNQDEDPPPAIDNSSLLTRPTKEGGAVRLKQSANYMTFTRDMWLFFVSVYGGGPEVFLVHDHQPTAEEVAKWDEERQKDLQDQNEKDLQLDVTQLTIDAADSDQDQDDHFGETDA